MTSTEQELLEMLTYKRPAFSHTEQQFIARYIMPFNPIKDNYGNLWVTQGESDILWSCHIDTRHQTEGRQAVRYKDNVVKVMYQSECLGADNTVGIWLMINMLRNKIPGLYIFHAFEEQDEYTGAEFIAQHTPDLLRGIRFAIAFDRRGTQEIITHQTPGCTASYAFALSLAKCLTPMEFFPSLKGVWTDTAAYAKLIPECTNISAGFYSEHTPDEYLYMDYASRLLDLVLTADWSGLRCERIPS